MAMPSRRTAAFSVRREGRRAAARAEALAVLRRLRSRISAELTEHDEIIIAAELTDAVLDQPAADIGRPIPHTHV
ncbi:MAG TPA: hypothetical protein VFR23_13850 [Jiangellaceae bacterium]|nr:hypothetical protein [Jiangellaceae bacterium]